MRSAGGRDKEGEGGARARPGRTPGEGSPNDPAAGADGMADDALAAVVNSAMTRIGADELPLPGSKRLHLILLGCRPTNYDGTLYR